ncbi:hypothetical protein [Shinella sp.]|uniref:hypothetical protein n=1 Tax=Shinella sp. TaxID=1870904 RepID=UPI0039E71460
MNMGKRSALLKAAENSGSIRTFPPAATIKCDGIGVFRSQTARDVACLLDLNPSIASWRCMSVSLDVSGGVHIPDFEVFHEDGGVVLIDAPDRMSSVDVAAIEAGAARHDYRYQLLSRPEVYDGFRLRNARDLLRYGNHAAPLGDRLRVLAALDEHGSLPLIECFKAFVESRPVPGIASLILRGYLEVDLDDAPLGPESQVRRIR